MVNILQEVSPEERVVRMGYIKEELQNSDDNDVLESRVGPPLSDPLESVRVIIRSFIQRASPNTSLNFDPPPTDELEAGVIKEVRQLNIDSLPSVRKSLSWACQIAEGFYPSHPMDLKILIAIMAIIFFHTDDNFSKTREDLYAFQFNLLNGRPQADPILDCLPGMLVRMWKYYHPLAANAICIGYYDLLQGTAMESTTRMMKHRSSAPEFPNYVRLKSGVSVPFAHWLFYNHDSCDSDDNIRSYIQIIPDFANVIDWVNDILSFYKEELAGEDDNLVHMYAKTSGKSVVVILNELCEETLLRIGRISESLSETPRFLKAFEGFIARYIRFHTSTARYRLKELMG